MWPEPSKSKISAGVVLAIVLYGAYLAAVVGIWKSSLWALLVFELSIFGIYLLLMGIGLVCEEYLAPVWHEYGPSSPFKKPISLWLLAIILFICALFFLVAILYGNTYLTILFAMIGGACFYLLISREENVS